MKKNVDIKFRLRFRRIKDSATGESVMGSKNVLITMRVAYGSLRMEFTTGYHIDEECWDAKAQYAIGGSNGKSADEINGGLMRLSRYAHDTVNLFMEKGVEPTQEEFKTAFQMIRDGEKPKVSAKKKSRKDNENDDSDHTDIYSSKQDTNSPKQTFNNFSEP